VNFDNPGTYHLYYGDETGRPGTILTFFPWEHVAPGRLGVGETQETAFRVPEGAIGYWTHRFVVKGVAARFLSGTACRNPTSSSRRSGSQGVAWAGVLEGEGRLAMGAESTSVDTVHSTHASSMFALRSRH
jgi:catechol 2,3-dioxygenase-like lactoylglutathione lyase family enzyme